MHTATKHTHEDMVMETEDSHRPQEKRRKKKQAVRKPLCTFFNYLKEDTPAAEETNHNKNFGSTPRIEEEKEEDEDEAKMEVEEKSFGGVSAEMKKLSLENSLDDSSTTSIETVNTSNKSVDAMVRDNRFNFDAATPAVDRWVDPPPPRRLPKNDDDDLGAGHYITSRCESDTESEEEMDKPKEIVIKKRGHRSSRRHRWQERRTDVRALPIRGNITALPKITVRPYKV